MMLSFFAYTICKDSFPERTAGAQEAKEAQSVRAGADKG